MPCSTFAPARPLPRPSLLPPPLTAVGVRALQAVRRAAPSGLVDHRAARPHHGLHAAALRPAAVRLQGTRRPARAHKRAARRVADTPRRPLPEAPPPTGSLFSALSLSPCSLCASVSFCRSLSHSLLFTPRASALCARRFSPRSAPILRPTRSRLRPPSHRPLGRQPRHRQPQPPPLRQLPLPQRPRRQRCQPGRPTRPPPRRPSRTAPR